MPALTVKWGKEKLAVDADLNEAPILLKSQLFAMTGVAPDRQKVMIKGKILGDESWNGITVADGATIMMMGSAAPVPDAVVIDDSPAVALPGSNTGVLLLPRGLVNIGNTCYLNSVIQTLNTIPELRRAFGEYEQGTDLSPAAKIVKSLKSTFNVLNGPRKMNDEDDSHTPLAVISNVHQVMPHFAQRTAQGVYEQQDANECFTEVLRYCLQGLASRKDPSFNVNDFFRGQFKVTQKCLESDSEPEQTSSEDFYQLSCFLSQEVKYIQTGIKQKLTEEIVKNSTQLGRDAKWLKKELISRLPAYVSVQMVRFFYKESSKSSAKVLKDVKFPMILDLCDICTPELQEKMRPHRDAVKAEEDAKIERMRKKKLEGRDAVNNDDDDGIPLPFSFPDDPGSNNSGFYQLQAVITHQGRSVNSGHYVAWVRLRDDKWAMCDDSDSSGVTIEDVLKLSGGGDWHTAYVLLYGPRLVKEYPKLEEEKPADTTEKMES